MIGMPFNYIIFLFVIMIQFYYIIYNKYLHFYDVDNEYRLLLNTTNWQHYH